MRLSNKQIKALEMALDAMQSRGSVSEEQNESIDIIADMIAKARKTKAKERMKRSIKQSISIKKQIGSISMILVLILSLTTLASCTTRAEECAELFQSAEDLFLAETLEDQHGNVIQKTVFNKSTGHTTIYSFQYEQRDSVWICVNTDKVVISAGGDVIYPEK